MPRTRKTPTPEPTTEAAAEPNGNAQSLLDAWDTGATQDAADPATETPPPPPVPDATADDPIAPLATEPDDVPAPVRDLEAAPRRKVSPRAKTAPRRPRAATGARPGFSDPGGSVARDGGEPPAAPADPSLIPHPSSLIPPADDSAPTFEDLGLRGPLLRSIKDVGYEEPTPIQLRVIPVLLAGQDVIAQAQTGSGKTAAFGLPIIETIDPRDRHVQALVLCPTRELAIQVAEALHKYGRHKEVDTLPIYGGQPYERQFRGLQRGVHIVVGTPGRVMDHMRRGTLDLAAIRFFVLDEADEMLDMGFVDDIEWILDHAPVARQTALFSATMPPRIVELAGNYLLDPERITVAGKQMTVPETHQISYEVPRNRKTDALTRILDAETPSLAMIFCRTKLGVDDLGEALMARGYQVETLHGDLSQAQRDRVMRRFRTGQADTLIATDVASRGLDIPDVSHVLNFDVPESAEAYVHRIGRTGRAGRTGVAITLVTPRETRWLRQIERTIRARIEARRLPTLADVAERRREIMREQILDVLTTGGFETYRDVVGDLTEDHDALDVAAAVAKLYADETGRATPAESHEDDIAAVAPAPRPQQTPGRRDDRRPDQGRPPAGRGEPGMVRLFLNVGRTHYIRPQDVVGAIANEAQIPGRSIGAIDILDAHTFVDIPQEFVDRVLRALQTATIKGRPVRAEISPEQGGPRPPRGPGGPGDRRPDRDRPRDGARNDRPWNGPRRDNPTNDARPVRVGGVRLDRDRDDARRPDRSGPPRFRVRRDDRPGGAD